MKNRLFIHSLRGPFAGKEQREIHQNDSHSDVTRIETVVMRNEPKSIDGTYRHMPLGVPREIDECPGILVFGRHIKSLVFSTDLAIICNCDADAVFAVYPFTCQPVITQALVNAAGRPVFTGVAGTTTTGARSSAIAVQSEMQGAYGVIVNSPTSVEDVHQISSSIDIPLILTVVTFDEHIAAKIDAGAAVVNVAAGKDTPLIVQAIREKYPDIPIIASGGKTGASIEATIEAGADAITWVPPSMQELQRTLMDTNRAEGQPPESDAVA